MKKTLLMLGTVAILFAALFCIEFVACQTADVVKEPETARNDVSAGTKLFGTLSKVDSHLEIFKVQHPYDTINDQSERTIPEQGNGKYEAVVPSGWYRFTIDGKDSRGITALGIREGLNERNINFDDEGKMALFQTRPAKNIEITTENPFDQTTFPERFAERVAKIETETKENKGIVVIGRIVDAEGKPVRHWDYMTVMRWGTTYPSGAMPFPEGWFSTVNLINAYERKHIEVGEWHPDWGKTARLYFYSATYEPAKIEFPIVLGTVYYANVVLDKTPENELVSFSGTLLDEEDKPIDGASLRLRFPFPNVSGGNDQAVKMTKTDKDGRFSFEKITPQRYQLWVRKEGLVDESRTIPLEDLGTEQTLYFYKPRTVEIEYVFQPDGSRDFTKGNLQPLTATFKPEQHAGYFWFATGKVSDSSGRVGNAPPDIQFSYANGELGFGKDWVNHPGGFYEAGEVPFESVKEADGNADAYSRELKPPVFIKLNHVYIVQTTEGKYAKLVVRKITPPLPIKDPATASPQ